MVRSFTLFLTLCLIYGSGSYYGAMADTAMTNSSDKKGEIVQYSDGQTTHEGYWAASACNDPLNAPLVMIVHQWKGLSDHEMDHADMLSEECYNAFAIDMYGAGIRPATNKEAAIESAKYKNDPGMARARLKNAYEYAMRRFIEPPKTAVAGYCFGGTMALEMARSGANINAVVSFHGGLATNSPVTQPHTIKAPLQIHHGADDPYVNHDEVQTFIHEMNTVQADWHMIQYAGAVHSFTDKSAGDDPTQGVAYNARADARSWGSMLLFLDETIR